VGAGLGKERKSRVAVVEHRRPRVENDCDDDDGVARNRTDASSIVDGVPAARGEQRLYQGVVLGAVGAGLVCTVCVCVRVCARAGRRAEGDG
jgi:hypothetical protein